MVGLTNHGRKAGNGARPTFVTFKLNPFCPLTFVIRADTDLYPGPLLESRPESISDDSKNGTDDATDHDAEPERHGFEVADRILKDLIHRGSLRPPYLSIRS